MPFYSNIERHVVEISTDMNFEKLKLVVSDAFQWPLLYANENQFLIGHSLVPEHRGTDILCTSPDAAKGVRVINPKLKETEVLFEFHGKKVVIKVGSYMDINDLKLRIADEFGIPSNVSSSMRFVVGRQMLLSHSPGELLAVEDVAKQPVYVHVPSENSAAAGGRGRTRANYHTSRRPSSRKRCSISRGSRQRRRHSRATASRK